MIYLFRNDVLKISIILNVHVLDEGIDIPECDSVFLTNPNNNPTNIIQRISRANRLSGDDSKIAKILVWSKDTNKITKINDIINKFIEVREGNANNMFFNNGNKDDDSVDNIHKGLSKEGNYKLACRYCLKILSTNYGVRRHELICHKNEVAEGREGKKVSKKIGKNAIDNYARPDNECIHCGKRLSNKYNCIRHMETCQSNVISLQNIIKKKKDEKNNKTGKHDNDKDDILTLTQESIMEIEKNLISLKNFANNYKTANNVGKALLLESVQFEMHMNLIKKYHSKIGMQSNESKNG